ncbi:MAG: bifunctional enoyl-CoA hydratase/phosphate acetyltransferase [Ectothiorhodospiraceae bacterium]|nr:bifunctional enoyl-CoA hydratase/phosphate acetyltransferase [Ectothiorhodospiraceae bacterium]
MKDDLIENIPYSKLETGQSASLTRKLTLSDLRFHVDDDQGQLDPKMVSSDLYYRIITHGMWGTALIAVLVATRLPGPGSRLLANDLRYNGSVGLGDTVAVTVTVREKRPDRQVLLDCEVRTEAGVRVVHGTALVEAPERQIRESREALEHSEAGGRRQQMQRLLRLAAGLEPLRTAVVHPVDSHSLAGAVEAGHRGLIHPVLVGPEWRIRGVAEEHGLALDHVDIIDTEHSHAAAARSVELARDGEVGALMKGSLHTDEFMQPVVSRHGGLRTDRRMSHVWVMDVPTYPRPLCITDSALNIRPDLMAKADITRNVIELVQAMGVEQPRVAILSATEEVNPQIQSTLDAAALCKMADRGQIRGGELDGPLAFDNAISEVAARTKGIRSPVAGRPDILLAPDLESANMLGKQLRYLADAETAGIVLGARVPVVLTSRADDMFSRIASCAIALLMAGRKERKPA